MAIDNAKYIEAERYYVEEQKTLEAIEKIPGMPSLRTLQTWSSKGDWKSKRSGFLKLEQSLHSNLYRLATKLIEQNLELAEAGKAIDYRAMSSAYRAIAVVKNAITYEEQLKDEQATPEQREAEQKKSMSEKISEFFGIDIEDDAENITGIDDLES